MKLTLGFSPCPNDTFIFDALVNQKIDTGDLEFEVWMEDVETLNQWALSGKPDISKISYGVLPPLTGSYNLLDAGSALGRGAGPLLIAKKQIPDKELRNCTVAIPGENTTAHLLFSLAYPEARIKKFMIFSEIEEAILSGGVDCGVIIHENRFTYQKKGLVRLADLGQYWEQKTGYPIPLGGIIMRKSLGSEKQQEVSRLIRKSLEYAFQHYPLLPDYVKKYAQEMEEDVMRQHIDLYVNNYSLSLGHEGRNAINTLCNLYASTNSLGALPVISFAG
jgi:1,4-dihydroxy-6-naphthoate synthase